MAVAWHWHDRVASPSLPWSIGRSVAVELSPAPRPELDMSGGRADNGALLLPCAVVEESSGGGPGIMIQMTMRDEQERGGRGEYERETPLDGYTYTLFFAFRIPRLICSYHPTILKTGSLPAKISPQLRTRTYRSGSCPWSWSFGSQYLSLACP